MAAQQQLWQENVELYGGSAARSNEIANRKKFHLANENYLNVISRYYMCFQAFFFSSTLTLYCIERNIVNYHALPAPGLDWPILTCNQARP